MIRSLQATLVAVLLVGMPTIASSEPKKTTPGAQMQKEGLPPSKSADQKTQPGASEYAPGKSNDTSAPGNSETAPGQANDTTAPGNSENASGQKK